MPREDAGPDFIEALARGLEVLRTFRPGRRVSTLSEIAVDTGLAVERVEPHVRLEHRPPLRLDTVASDQHT